MKKIHSLLFCASLFSGTVLADNHYIPLLYNLSTIFDFNPVKGAVKSIDTYVQENGVVKNKIALKLNKQGCIESLELNDVSSGSKTFLKFKNGNLVGEKHGKPISFVLSNKCDLLSTNENGDELTYTLNSNGMIKDTYFLGQKIAEHFYDGDSNLIRSEFYGSGKVMFKSEITYVDKIKKPLDYKLLNTAVYKEGYIATSSCDYSVELVPEVCKITIQRAGNPVPNPVVMTAHTKAEFY